ncbi:three component ABC system middle component [Cohnella laeviribosi]|uniref:three component ABC system middle component n=1 Tax=Cohnella laeviribosi TaxID=380174 RepID=UPI003D1FD273
MDQEAILIKNNDDDPVELRSLLNPAFCAVVLSEFIKGYQSYVRSGAPFPLLFFVLPLALQKSVRIKMNRCNAATGLHSWLIQHADVRVDIALVIDSLVHFTKKATLFGIHRGVLLINEDGSICIGNKRTMKQPTGWNDERSDILKKSMLLGKWFGQIHDASTIFSLFGVRIS